MNWKPWILGGVALVVFDACLVLGVKAYWRAQAVPSVVPVPAASMPVVPAASSARFTPAAPRPVQVACVAGLVWQYDAASQRWFKRTPDLRCDVRTGEWLPSPGYAVRYGRGHEPKSS